jgi:hypothetical protein
MSATRASRTSSRLDEMRDLKPLPDRDPARAKLASAIALHAGAVRDLQIAEQAAALAAERCWRAQAHLDELYRVVAAPSGALAADFIASVAAGNPCDTAVLERSSVDARAQIAAAENDVRVWEQTSEECALAVRAKEADVATARDRVERAARAVICNSDNVARLIDELAGLQSRVVSARSVLRFISRHGVNGEMEGSLKEQAERLLWRDLTGMETTPESAAWSAAFDELQSNSEAELPIAGAE